MTSLWILLGTAFALLVELPIWLNWSRYCFNNWDLGIYAQALARLSWADPNPWLSVREVKIFNDHFDPILFLIAPLAKWLDPALVALAADSLFVLAGAFAVAWAVGPRNRLLQWALVAVFLLSRGTLGALTFPSHPTTWAVLPLVVLMGFAARESFRGVLAALLTLFLFKEEYVYVGVSLGLFYFFHRRPGPDYRKWGVTLIAVSAAWAAGVFLIRPKLLGTTVGYTGSLLQPWLENPLGTLRERVLDFGIIKAWVEFLVPLAPFLYVAKKFQSRLNWAALAAMVPLFLIRLVAGKWSQHYGIALTACLVGLFFSATPSEKALDVDTTRTQVFWRRASLAALLIALLIQFPFFGKYSLKTSLRGGLRHCPADPARGKELRDAQQSLSRFPESVIYAMGNLVPRLLQHGEVRHLGTNTSDLPSEFIVIVEKAPTGDPWPLGFEGLSRLRQGWEKQFATEVLFSGRFVEVKRFYFRM